MVYTRSSASRNTAPTRGKPPIENYEVEPESSDEDDEGIPSQRAVSTPRRKGAVTLCLPKRSRDDDSPSSGKSKRRKPSSQIPSLGGDRPRLGSNSSQTAPRAVIKKDIGKEASNESPSPDAENEVSDELVKCVSSILHPRDLPVQQQTLEESPSDQLLQEELLLATDQSKFEHGVESGPEEHSDRLSKTETSHSDVDDLDVKDNASAPDDEPIAASEDLSMVPGITVDLNDTARLSPAPHEPSSDQQDPYEIPISPPPIIHLDEEDALFVEAPESVDEPMPEREVQETPSTPPFQVLRLPPGKVPSQTHTPLKHGDTEARDTIYPVEKAPRGEANLGVEPEKRPDGIHRTALAAEENIARRRNIPDKSRSSAEDTDANEYLAISDSDADKSGGSAEDPEHDEYLNISDSETEKPMGSAETPDDNEYLGINDSKIDNDHHRDNSKSPSIDGVDSDVGNESDIDLSVEESFSRDIMLFKNRRIPEEEVLSEVFDGPPEDDLIAIHIQPDVFKKAMNIMELNPWCDSRRGGPIQTLDAAMAKTQPGRYIMPFLAKLRRLYLATPRAPLLREQNMFLSEHSDMITYYFSKIDTLVTHICTERLKRPEQNQSATDQNGVKRSKMADEIMSLTIPTILRAIESAWKLGGDQENNAQLTTSTVEFLRRGIGWINRLYYRASEELSKKDKSSAWDRMIKNRGAKLQNRGRFAALLDRMVDRLNRAPDMLLAKENEEMEKQRKLIRQREIAMRWEEDRRERQRRIKEQNRRAFLSIEGKSMHSTVLPSPSRKATSTIHQLPLSKQKWSQEEKEFLFRQLSQSYPNLPDLTGHIRQELNRDLDDIRGMSRVILGAILKEAYDEVGVETSSTNIEAEIENIFASSGHNYNN
ncbi:hypothetical protein MGN70_000027 [Eutypa lata]|nr:hypothetical protein MGN70_000027 [Eutypa lata]